MEHCVQLILGSLVKVRIVEYVEAIKPFIHQDRCLDHNVFLYIVSGEMKIWEDDIEYIVRAGEIFYLKSGIHHYGKEEIPKGTKWFYIHFYTDCIKDELQNFNDYGTYVKNQEFLLKDFDYYITLPKQLKIQYPLQLEKKLRDMCENFNSDNNLRLIHLSIGTSELLYDIYNSYKRSIKSDKADIITQKLMNYLQNKLTEKVNSKNITDYMNLNYNYISQIFKAKTGMSITEYHTKMRITESSRMLRESSLNVSEISNAMGYEDPLYFSYVFKKITGLSPTEYQKQAYSLGR